MRQLSSHRSVLIQGPWEVEVSYGGEVDLHQHLKGCDKNPGHHKFVPVDQFNVDHLPPGCHDNDLVDLVRAMSDLTVRVDVKYVSESRPETVLGRPFPCYKDRGSGMMRQGTGFVTYVCRDSDKKNPYKTCPCEECVNSPTPKTQFAHIHVQTATHVVYDELEATHTTCHLFFDRGNKLTVHNGVVTLSAVSLSCSDDCVDFCEIRCVTHDLDLADKLYKMLEHLRDLEVKYNSRQKQESLSPVEELPDAISRLTIIVSHPHGCSKQVSVGCSVDKHDNEPGNSQDKDVINDESNDGSNDEHKDFSDYFHIYTAATCPGSSGARVFIMHKRQVYRYWTIVHCGSCEGDNNLNFSRLS